jgi:hypothetical protein
MIKRGPVRFLRFGVRSNLRLNSRRRAHERYVLVRPMQMTCLQDSRIVSKGIAKPKPLTHSESISRCLAWMIKSKAVFVVCKARLCFLHVTRSGIHVGCEGLPLNPKLRDPGREYDLLMSGVRMAANAMCVRCCRPYRWPTQSKSQSITTWRRVSHLGTKAPLPHLTPPDRVGVRRGEVRF